MSEFVAPLKTYAKYRYISLLHSQCSGLLNGILVEGKSSPITWNCWITSLMPVFTLLAPLNKHVVKAALQSVCASQRARFLSITLIDLVWSQISANWRNTELYMKPTSPCTSLYLDSNKRYNCGEYLFSNSSSHVFCSDNRRDSWSRDAMSWHHNTQEQSCQNM